MVYKKWSLTFQYLLHSVRVVAEHVAQLGRRAPSDAQRLFSDLPQVRQALACDHLHLDAAVARTIVELQKLEQRVQ